MIDRDFAKHPEPEALGKFVARIGFVGLIVAYASVIPLKALGYLPPTVTWAGVVLVPATWFLALASTAVLPSRFPRRRALMIAFSLICLAFAFVSVYWQGWV